MKFMNPMLVVADMDRSVEFYKEVLGLHVIMDFGANKTLTGGLALQTAETYKKFIDKDEIFLEAAALKYTLKKMILMTLRQDWKNAESNMCILLWSIPGGSEWSAFTIRTGILWKLAKI